MDFKAVTKRKTARTRSVEILLDEDLLGQRDDLFLAIRQAQRVEAAFGGDMASPVPGLRQELVDLAEEIDKATVSFKFKSMPPRDWSAAVEKYQDKDGTLTEAFEVFLIAKASVDPKLTQTDVKKMYKSPDWSPAEMEQLFDAAYNVNREVRNILFTQAGISEMLNSSLSSTTAQSEE